MYTQRLLQPIVEKHLFQNKVIIIYGARQVGKTTLVQKILAKNPKNSIYFNCDEADVRQQLSRADTSQRLKQIVGDHHLVVFDEAQRVVDIGLKLKLLVDNFPHVQVIATGSSSFELANRLSEPLTGRSFEYWLYPFSVPEILQSTDSLNFNRQLENLLVYGSYPDVYQTQSLSEKTNILKSITNNYLFKDILSFNRIRNSDLVLKLLQSLAFQIGNEVSYNELSNFLSVNKQTIMDYVSLLEKSFIIFHLPPFSRNLRQEINKLRKIYFYDLGIRNAVINNLNPLTLRDDVGRLWENFLIAEKFKQQFNPGAQTNYYFWRTYQKQEIDLVEDKNGLLSGYEIKWGSSTKKPPRSWLSAYPRSTWQLINQDNYQSFLLPSTSNS